MPETGSMNLKGVPETLLIPLYDRAMESQRSDAMMRDERAVAMVVQASSGFDRIRKIRMNELLKAMRIIFTREIRPLRPGFPNPSPAGGGDSYRLRSRLALRSCLR